MISDEPIGIIAGAGRLPFSVADGIITSGRKLVIVGISGFANPWLEGLADEFAWAGVTRMSKWIRVFKHHNVRKVVMIGSVKKTRMHERFRFLRYLPDLRSAKIWYCQLRHDKRDNPVLLAVAEELAKEGIELMSSVEYCKEHLAHEGVMTQLQPSSSMQLDIEFGWKIARASADLDVGQSLAVKERDILAVEAVEGTDAMIARAGSLCKKGNWTMIKVARPNQDMRFDVPTVGPETIKNLAAAKCATLVVEAEKTLIADKPATLALADKLKIAVVGK
ncbi:MAG: UDP-2,3-diacylglucosamine diphosphatase LpxI [Phycisphaerae bacterium]|nr:UDP-2,3-diacylglucosamine diphosphatase LpxI [Phycisphaerae bacterium]